MTKSAHLLIAGMVGMQKHANWFTDYFGDNYGSVLDKQTEEMRKAHVPSESILNFRDMWKRNQPSWWNPFDFWGNGGKYLRNANQIEEWRQNIMDKSRNDWYKQKILPTLQPKPQTTK